MYRSLLQLIVCPLCGTDLYISNSMHQNEDSDEVISGELTCKSSHTFPITNGIVRLFVASPSTDSRERDYIHIRNSFSSEWGDFGNRGNAWGQSPQKRQELFLECVGTSWDKLRGKRILDVGCGHGEVELGLLGSGAEIVAMDISSSVDAVRAAILGSHRRDTVVHLIQASIHALPIRDECFDIVHCAGVLHHTPDTRQSFDVIQRKVRPGGSCFIEIYSTDHKNAIEHIQHVIFELLRRTCCHLPHNFLHGLCRGLAPVMAITLRVLEAFHGKKRYMARTLRELELSLFDALSPEFAWHHTSPEIIDWFERAGFDEIRKSFSTHNGIGIVGKRIACSENRLKRQSCAAD